MNNDEIIDKAIEEFESHIQVLELCISALKVEKIKLITTPNNQGMCEFPNSPLVITKSEDTIQSKHKAEIDKDYQVEFAIGDELN